MGEVELKLVAFEYPKMSHVTYFHGYVVLETPGRASSAQQSAAQPPPRNILLVIGLDFLLF